MIARRSCWTYIFLYILFWFWTSFLASLRNIRISFGPAWLYVSYWHRWEALPCWWTFKFNIWLSLFYQTLLLSSSSIMIKHFKVFSLCLKWLFNKNYSSCFSVIRLQPPHACLMFNGLPHCMSGIVSSYLLVLVIPIWKFCRNNYLLKILGNLICHIFISSFLHFFFLRI